MQVMVFCPHLTRMQFLKDVWYQGQLSRMWTFKRTCSLYLKSWWRSQQVISKRQIPSPKLHGVTFHKNIILVFIAMSIHHNIAKADEAKLWEENYNLFLLTQQDDTLKLMCVIWFTDNAVTKTAVTKKCINAINLKYVIFDYYTRGFGASGMV
jgi:hypothetical protein